MGRKNPPKQFAAYVVVASDEPSMPVESVLIDKGNLVVRDWNVMNFESGKETGAVGHRLSLLCADCRVLHGMAGVLGHDGDCGSDDVRSECQQVLKDAKKRVLAEAAS